MEKKGAGEMRAITHHIVSHHITSYNVMMVKRREECQSRQNRTIEWKSKKRNENLSTENTTHHGIEHRMAWRFGKDNKKGKRKEKAVDSLSPTSPPPPSKNTQ